ncbi:MAG: hypothetical protein CMP53_09300 [Flavobacteriales bacterium]|nr:hypothetical protein [Flavobacteriales bacterium]|tara:strand:- start:78 stop:704 length:627 start_codon:yes stop_codon:yes gene_type:complete
MKRMSPVGSHHRAQGRREPTDAQKTARIAMIRNRQRMARLGAAWPNAPGIDDGDISNDLAYDAQGNDTWQRPEPNPNYDSQFNPAIKDLERLAIKEEKLEEELKALNATIAAKEVSNDLSLQDPDVMEARSIYKDLDKTRQQLSTVGNRTSSGIREVKRGGWTTGSIGAGTGIGLTLLALYIYRTVPRRGGGARYIGTKDRLSIFGNF